MYPQRYILLTICLALVSIVTAYMDDFEESDLELTPRRDLDLGVCANSFEAAEICLACHALKLRHIRSCCTVREAFSACDQKFSDVAAEANVIDTGSDALDGSDVGETPDKRGKGPFRTFYRAWYKGKRGYRHPTGNRIFSNYNRMWYKG